MTDINTVWNPTTGYGDYVVVGAGLASHSDLETAILISIFTDRQATADDVIPDGTTDRRGWWADDTDYPIGSRLWLLRRAKQTQQTLRAAFNYLVEALQWLIDDGVVAKFAIYVEFTKPGMLGMQVIPYDKNGNILAANYTYTLSLS